MKIFALSDLHGKLPTHESLNIKDCDVLCIAGDICPDFRVSGGYEQKQWLKTNFVPWAEIFITDGMVKDVVFIGGNHDWYLEEIFETDQEAGFRKTLPEHIHYLRDDFVVIDGKKFYGTPWTPEFYNWAFMEYEGELDKIFEKIPTDTDVLLSHGPAQGFNDLVEGRGRPLGSKALTRNIHRARPTLAVFGHIHTGSHKPSVIKHRGNTTATTTLVNVSLLDEAYIRAFHPFEFDI
tara:strand:+ start:8955 stop:9662 length:708 start_codon:yes stop_codon:yes gene_type:complete